MCAPLDSTWSDPMMWRAIFTGMGVVGMYLGGRLAREVSLLNTAVTAAAEKSSTGPALDYRIMEEAHETRRRLTSELSASTRALERIASKIEDRTALERRKQVVS